jgi:hypothetical protein
MTLTSQTSGIRNRRITTRYPIGPVKDGRDEGIRYVEVATTHVRERKILTSRLTYIDVIDEGGYKIERWGSDYPYATITLTAIARYSDKALIAQHVAATDQFEAGQVDKAVATLLLDQIREAQKGVPA